MHNSHINPLQIRARIRRALDPCMIQRATVWRDEEKLFTTDVWIYRKSSFSASLSMALSGVLSGDGTSDRALVLGDLPEGERIHTDDVLAVPGLGRWRVLSAAPWPFAAASAIVTLTLKELDA